LEHANKEKYEADYCGEEGDDVCCGAIECHDAGNAKKEEAGGDFCQRNGARIRKEAEPPALLISKVYRPNTKKKTTYTHGVN
jgi:hypothetical protein